MKTEIKESRFYTSVLMALCFFVGIAVGTIWVNMMSEEIQGELSLFGQAWQTASQGDAVPRPDLFGYVLMKREAAMGLLWLIGMTVFSRAGLLVTVGLGGFSMAAVVAMTTIQAGIFGIPVYLLSVFPQAIFYIPVMGVLLFWGMEPQKKTHIAGVVVLAVVIAAGAFAETCLNPFFLNFLNLMM